MRAVRPVDRGGLACGRRARHPPLVAFCATCCAEVFTADGDWGRAEVELRDAITKLEHDRASGAVPGADRAAGGAARRAGTTGGGGAAARRRSHRRHARRARAAGARAGQRCRRPPRCSSAPFAAAASDSLGTIDAMAVLADAYVAGRPARRRPRASRRGCKRSQPDPTTAASRAARRWPRRACSRGAHRRHRAVIAAGGAPRRAWPPSAPARSRWLRPTSCSRELRAADAPDVALGDARAAVTAFEAAGASARRDEAAALARALGDHSRVGREGPGRAHRARARRCCACSRTGLTNAEIGERLFISPKTAENHVSSILTKLNVRSRTEAAAYALTRSGGPHRPQSRPLTPASHPRTWEGPRRQR